MTSLQWNKRYYLSGNVLRLITWIISMSDYKTEMLFVKFKGSNIVWICLAVCIMGIMLTIVSVLNLSQVIRKLEHLIHSLKYKVAAHSVVLEDVQNKLEPSCPNDATPHNLDDSNNDVICKLTYGNFAQKESSEQGQGQGQTSVDDSQKEPDDDIDDDELSMRNIINGMDDDDDNDDEGATTGSGSADCNIGIVKIGNENENENENVNAIVTPVNTCVDTTGHDIVSAPQGTHRDGDLPLGKTIPTITLEQLQKMKYDELRILAKETFNLSPARGTKTELVQKIQHLIDESKHKNV